MTTPESSNTPQPALPRTALITGATSGLGYAAAIQAAQDGYRPVLITGRDRDRADQAKSRLAAEFGSAVFESATVDLNKAQSVRGLIGELAANDTHVTYLLLNAGMVSGPKPVRTDDGVEVTFASSLVGHHQLTMGLLAADLLVPDASIIIAGSEAARSDMPTFTVTELPRFAEDHFDGDLRQAAIALIRGKGPNKYTAHRTYADAKSFVALWAAALGRKLPAGMTVNAVSPGAAPGTEAARNRGIVMRKVLMPMMDAMPSKFGMSASVPVAASRYLEVSKYSRDVTGKFFASAPKKLTGPLLEQQLDHVLDLRSQDAAWEATVEVAGAGYPVEA